MFEVVEPMDLALVLSLEQFVAVWILPVIGSPVLVQFDSYFRLQLRT